MTLLATTDLIAPLAVRELAKSRVLREAVLLPTPEGWVMRIRTGPEERTLKMRDENAPRYFQKLDAAARYAQKLGVPRLFVELADWLPAAKKRHRFATTKRR
jgi:hypothetical protein